MEEKEKEELVDEIQELEETEVVFENEDYENLEDDIETEVDEEDVETEEYEELEELEQTERYESKKPIGRLITMVAFTAIMLVSSTYAWFSTQKNVTLGGLKGKVNVAESLQISLDALNWTNSIDLSEEGIEAYFEQTNSTFNTSYDLTNPYTGRTNVLPTELFPVSTTAQSGDGIGIQRLNMYSGINTDGIVLSDIDLVEEIPESGYYAIDFFLQNVSSEEAVANDLLKLDSNSELTLLSTDKNSTGLQNTVRVAFALFDNDGTDKIKVNKTPSQAQILEGTNNQNIIDVAIWEPNASGDDTTNGFGAHVPFIIQNNNRVTWSVGDADTYFDKTIASPEVIRFDEDDLIPTYALTATSKNATYTIGSGATAQTVEGIKNIYDWANNTATTGLVKQNTLKTTTEGVTELNQLVSVTDGTTAFSIAPGEYHKLRMYVWLEGQDVDCTNYASLGGGIYLDVGITKGDTNSEPPPPTPTPLPSTSETTPYLPEPTFTHDQTTTLANGLTIKDSSQNEYVWIEVPRNATVYDEIGTELDLDNMTPEELGEACNDIEEELQEYAVDYRDTYDDYGDSWYSGVGIASALEYDAKKQKMLKSVYQNGGFYIGKYETGTMTAREEGDALTPAVIQANAYPYNNVTVAQAQQIADGMSVGGYTSSLMFGIQWDLVLRYLESKGVSQSQLKGGDGVGSTNWGNYYNNAWTISNGSAKYYTDSDGWQNGVNIENKSGSILLSTGASSSFSKQGIYDLAGNVYEWTLEQYTADSFCPCTRRGGDYDSNGDYFPASYRGNDDTDDANRNYGFRVSLY